MTQKLQFHPVADLFPLLQGEAFQTLVADIKKNGLLEPILVDPAERIIDGRNRYRACLAAGVEPRFTPWQGGDALPELALSLNLHRRHLNESQRAMVAGRLAKLLMTKEKNSAANLQRRSVGRICEKAARQVNVSPRLVAYAIKVLDHGCPELIAAVESGAFKVSAAARLTDLPPARQIEEVAHGPERAAAAARKRARQRDAAEHPIGSFGRLPQGGGSEQTVRMLWVTADSLLLAIQTLKRRGFHYES
jgi:hypothetical protein